MLTACIRSVSRLRWLILAQQVMGLFPFMWSSPEEGKEAPKFSVPLFLWTLTLQVVRVSSAVLQNFLLFSMDAEKVSDVVKGSVFVFANTLLSVSQLLQLLNSKRLVEILSELKYEDHVGQKTWRRRSFCDAVGHYVFIVVFVLGITAAALQIKWDDLHYILVMSNKALVIAFALIFSLLYQELLLILSSKLERLTSECAVQAGLTRSQGPAPDVEAISSPGASEGKPCQALLLHQLERRFREVGDPSVKDLVAFAPKATPV